MSTDLQDEHVLHTAVYHKKNHGRLLYGDCRTATTQNNFVLSVTGIATKI